MTVQPVDWESVEDALVELLDRACEMSALWEDQNLPQLDYPYASLRRSGLLPTGTTDETRTTYDAGQVGEEVELLTTNQGEFTVTLSFHMDEAHGANDPTQNAVHYAGLLQAKLRQLTTMERLDSAGLAVIQVLGVQDTSRVENGQFINHASLDVRFRVASQMTERIGFIAKVEVESSELGVPPTVIDATP